MSPRKAADRDAQVALQRLLEESQELQRRSEALAADVERLRAQVEAAGHRPASPERRRKPRLKGK